jgi:transposase
MALAAVRETDTIPVLANRHGVHPNQIDKWKSAFLENAERFFASESVRRTDNSEREGELLKKIGELTVERDFVARGLGREG